MTLKLNTLIKSTEHPEWGTWRVTKIPTPQEDWYHIRGASGSRVLFPEEYKRFWRMEAEEENNE